MSVISNCGPIFPYQFIPEGNVGADVSYGHIPYFHRFLCQCATAPALPFLWVIVITAHNKNNLLNKIKNIVPEYEPEGWDYSSGVDSTWTTETQDIIGCIFAQAVKLPGENSNIEHVGVTEGSRRGFINTPVMNGRQDFQTLDITFRETNQSFAEVIKMIDLFL